NGTMITFTVPAYLSPGCYFSFPPCLTPLAPSRMITPGTYSISVQNTTTGATSNSLPFTVTSNRPPPTNQYPVINSLSGPTQLTAGQNGTWTIQASDPQNGTLTYAINW